MSDSRLQENLLSDNRVPCAAFEKYGPSLTRFNPKLRQMGNYSENISIAKGFQITERFKLDFRAEAFNMFNRVRFGTGPTSLSDPNFGRILGNGDILNDPRRMQMALKLYF